MFSITASFAALMALWFVVLSARVSKTRGATKVYLGDGGNAAMSRSMRAQANAAEYMPLMLILLLLNEAQGSPVWWLCSLGTAMLVGRLLHGYAMSFSDDFRFGRFWGTVLTWVSLVAGAGECLWLVAVK